MSAPAIEPIEVVDAVEHYVSAELADAEKYENRTPLDESGIRSLHALAGTTYTLGFEAGARAEHRRCRAEAQRRRDRDRDAS